MTPAAWKTDSRWKRPWQGPVTALARAMTNAANALKEWQDKRPEAYQSSYQNRINEVLDRLLARENFAYSYTQDPLYRQYAQQYTQNAHNASGRCRCTGGSPDRRLRLQLAASAAQQAYQQQIGALNEAIPSLYSLALDTYTARREAGICGWTR